MTKSSTDNITQNLTYKRVLGVALFVGFVIYSIILIFATHLPNINTGIRTPGLDKVLHFLAYGCQGALAMSVFCIAGRASLKNIVVLIVVLACFGALDEITQPAFGRQAELLDWVADCTGIVLAVFFVMALFRFTKTISKKRAPSS